MPNIKVCLKCRQKFDILSEDYVKINRRYLHKECYESDKKRYDKMAEAGEKKKQTVKAALEASEQSIMKDISEIPTPTFEEKKPPISTKKKQPAHNYKKCFYCGGQVDIANEPFGKPRVNRYAHKECMDQNYDPDEQYVDKIYSYLKEEVGISYDYVQCDKQRLSYISKYGFTNEGILNALKYFYGVQKGTPEKSGNRIGIVPFVYQEAQQYFKDLEMRQKQIKKAGEKQIKVVEKIIEISTPEIEEYRRPHINLESLEG